MSDRRSHYLAARTGAFALAVTGALVVALVGARAYADQPNNSNSAKTSAPVRDTAPPTVAAPVRSTVRVIVTGLRNNKGVVYCKLHERRATFPSGKHASIRHAKVRPAGRQAICTFPGVPRGRYAAVIAHDENGNGKIDSNWIGIPKEGYGFSNNVQPLFSAPSFGSAGFPVTADAKVTIRVIYR